MLSAHTFPRMLGASKHEPVQPPHLTASPGLSSRGRPADWGARPPALTLREWQTGAEGWILQLLVPQVGHPGGLFCVGVSEVPAGQSFHFPQQVPYSLTQPLLAASPSNFSTP